MRLIDADKFLEYLIFSKHIDSLKCDEVKKAVEMCEVKLPIVYDIEPCNDAISRQAVLDGIEEIKQSPWATDKRNGFEYLITEALDIVADLCVKQEPPVRPQEPKYCDRNICIKNEYNGISCDECEVGNPCLYCKHEFEPQESEE